MRRVAAVAAIAIVHGVATVILFIGEFVIVGDIWDSGHRLSPVQRVWDATAKVFLSPLYLAVAALAPGWLVFAGSWEYGFMFANSLLWAVAIVRLWRYVRWPAGFGPRLRTALGGLLVLVGLVPTAFGVLQLIDPIVGLLDGQHRKTGYGLFGYLALSLLFFPIPLLMLGAALIAGGVMVIRAGWRPA